MLPVQRIVFLHRLSIKPEGLTPTKNIHPIQWDLLYNSVFSFYSFVSFLFCEVIYSFFLLRFCFFPPPFLSPLFLLYVFFLCLWWYILFCFPSRFLFLLFSLNFISFYALFSLVLFYLFIFLSLYLCIFVSSDTLLAF